MMINNIQMNNFERRINTVNSKSRLNSDKNIVSFKGGLPTRAYERATDGLATVLGKFASTKFAKDAVAFINGESKSKILKNLGKILNIKQKWFQHAIAAEAIFLTGFYMYNTKKSKKIPENQKRPMMVNQALVATLCTSLGYLVDSKISKAFKNMQDVFLVTNALPTADKMKGQIATAVKDKATIDALIKLPKKKLNGISSGIGKLKSVMVFGFIYRYFSPVFITPIANRVSEYMDKKSSKNQKAA